MITLSFVAVCVIPFALSERPNNSRPFDSRYGSRTTASGVNSGGVSEQVEATPAATPSCSPDINEGFDDIILPGWVMINHSSPLGLDGWFQGEPTAFAAFDGASNAYIAANFNNAGSVGTISNWLLTPQLTLESGSTLTFYTRTEISTFPDRLQVRMSTNGASTNVGTGATDVGDFTTLLLDINPTYTVGGYPETWTQFTVTVSGTAPGTLGRLAFRYFVEDGGPGGTRSDYIGIDRAVYTEPCATPSPTPTPTTFPTITPRAPPTYPPRPTRPPRP